MYTNGLYIDEIHTYHDWQLICTSVTIDAPERKTFYVSIPGRNGDLDLSEALTNGPRFGNRSLAFTFMVRDSDMEKWHQKYSQIFNFCHHRRRRICLDTDPTYFYTGRLLVQSEKTFLGVPTFTLQVDAEPYKRTIFTSLDDWLWNPFDFESDITRDYQAIQVVGEKMVVIEGSLMPIIPVIISSAPMGVVIKGKHYQLQAGENNILDSYITEDHDEWLFIGHGTITISYHWGQL